MLQLTNIIIISMLISAIINYFTRKKVYTSLNCGLFAWVGSDAKQFNPLLFNVLGVYNDSRGGDSCGIYYSKAWVKGINKFAKYENLVQEKKLHTGINLGKYPLIIGHCRKASVGSVNEANIQPVILVDAKDKVLYAQAHNGTLSNHKELAKKYDVKILDNETDSSVLAKLIYKKGFDILKEYEGTAALLINFAKEPKVMYAFHGKSSKTYNYYYNNEERPLHYWASPDGGTYISSEKPPLGFISGGIGEVKEFEYNVLYKLEGNEVTKIKTIDRTEKKEKKYESESTYSNHRGVTYWDEHSNFAYSNYSKNILNVELGHISGKKDKTLIRYDKGRFYVGEDIAHGEYNCDQWGFLSDKFLPNSPGRYHLWFFQGLLLVNKEAFNELIEICKKNNLKVEEALVGYDNILKVEKTLKVYSIFPFCRISDTSTGFMMGTDCCPSDNKSQFFDGSFDVLFSNNTVYFRNGDYSGRSKTSTAMFSLKDLMLELPLLETLDFGKAEEVETKPEEPKTKKKQNDDDDNTIIFCNMDLPTDCDHFGNIDGYCDTCSFNSANNNTDTEQAYLAHLIANKVSEVVDDLEDLIIEVETSGYQYSVKKELVLINKTKENLKTILS